MSSLDRAIEIAYDAHFGQKRFGGGDYIEHPLRVMRTMQNLGHSEATQIVAILHDVSEDCERWPIERLGEEGFGDDVLFPLELLTKQEGDDYDLYVQRLSVHPRSRAVKRGDLFDNMNLTGLDNPSKKRIVTIEKYGRALLYLSRFPQPRV